MGIPIILHESDAVGGLANRLVARWATTICSGFAPAKNEPRIQFTGNPVSASITRGEKERGFALTGFSGTRPILLILGGSQGSLAINEAVVAHLGDLLTLCDIIHITGEGKRIIQGTRHGYWQIPFAFEELPDLYAIANLALSRAGASTLAELAANGIPAILVPLRGVAHDHQEKNARRAEQTGGCVVLEQEDLPSTLVGTVRSLLPSDVRRKMGESLRTLHAPDAARQIVEVIARSLV
jgi:UDP-N-acetylglucosamine--N-acetylmuramyl-(pentapeptide) pyrophosphoryl-undecaprenol N-acetylglucosamine transferase